MSRKVESDPGSTRGIGSAQKLNHFIEGQLLSTSTKFGRYPSPRPLVILRTTDTQTDTHWLSTIPATTLYRGTHTPSHSTPPLMGGGPRQNIAIPFGTEKTRIVCLPDGKKSADTCNRFDRIPACDRQTDRQTDRWTDRRTDSRHLATA